MKAEDERAFRLCFLQQKHPERQFLLQVEGPVCPFRQAFLVLGIDLPGCGITCILAGRQIGAIRVFLVQVFLYLPKMSQQPSSKDCSESGVTAESRQERLVQLDGVHVSLDVEYDMVVYALNPAIDGKPCLIEAVHRQDGLLVYHPCTLPQNGDSGSIPKERAGQVRPLQRCNCTPGRLTTPLVIIS